MSHNVYMELAEVAQQIASKTDEAQKILSEITSLKARESELQSSIGLSAKTTEASKPRRPRIEPDTVAGVRRKAIAVMKDAGMWMSLGMIAEQVTEMFPQVDRAAVENQIRALTHMPDSGVFHNGKRANAAMYCWAESKPAIVM